MEQYRQQLQHKQSLILALQQQRAEMTATASSSLPQPPVPHQPFSHPMTQSLQGLGRSRSGREDSNLFNASLRHLTASLSGADSDSGWDTFTRKDRSRAASREGAENMTENALNHSFALQDRFQLPPHPRFSRSRSPGGQPSKQEDIFHLTSPTRSKLLQEAGEQ